MSVTGSMCHSVFREVNLLRCILAFTGTSILSINTCEIPACLYLAKHVSLVMLFIYQKNPYL